LLGLVFYATLLRYVVCTYFNRHHKCINVLCTRKSRYNNYKMLDEVKGLLDEKFNEQEMRLDSRLVEMESRIALRFDSRLVEMELRMEWRFDSRLVEMESRIEIEVRFSAFGNGVSTGIMARPKVQRIRFNLRLEMDSS